METAVGSLKNLFSHFLVVRVSESFQTSEKPARSAFVAYQLQAKNVGAHPNVVPSFCYPDIDLLEKSKVSAFIGESFTFTLTESDGSRVFGFCRRFIPVGGVGRFPECLCILSPHPFFGFFTELLQYLLVRWIIDPGATFSLLIAALQTGIPRPGELFRIRVKSDDGKFAEQCIIERNHPTYQPSAALGPLFRHLSLDNILFLFTALMCEQRIVLCASNLSTLSECIHAALGLIYPFEWPHIFIPLLPKSLLNYTCAPMPFVVGVRDSDMEDLLALPLEDIVIVHLDTDKLEITEGERNDPNHKTFDFPLPEELTHKLKKYLKSTKLEEQEIYCGFLAFFLNIFGHCDWSSVDSKGKFDVRAFVKSTAQINPDFATFVKAISNSQMVEQYFAKCISLERAGAFSSNGKNLNYAVTVTYPSIEEFEKWRLTCLSSKEKNEPYSFTGTIKKLLANMETAKSEQLFKASAMQIKKAALELTSNQVSKRSSKEILSELREASCDSRNFYTLMEVIISRFKDAKSNNWRHGHKGIALLEHLLKLGSDRVVFYSWQDHMKKFIYDFTLYSHKEPVVEETVRKAANRVMLLLDNVFALRVSRTYPKSLNINLFRNNEACDGILFSMQKRTQINSKNTAPTLSHHLYALTASGAGVMDYRIASVVERISPVIPSYSNLSFLFEEQHHHIQSDAKNVFAGLVPGMGIASLNRSASLSKPPLSKQNSLNRFFDIPDTDTPLTRKRSLTKAVSHPSNANKSSNGELLNSPSSSNPNDIALATEAMAAMSALSIPSPSPFNHSSNSLPSSPLPSLDQNSSNLSIPPINIPGPSSPLPSSTNGNSAFGTESLSFHDIHVSSHNSSKGGHLNNSFTDFDDSDPFQSNHTQIDPFSSNQSQDPFNSNNNNSHDKISSKSNSKDEDFDKIITKSKENIKQSPSTTDVESVMGGVISLDFFAGAAKAESSQFAGSSSSEAIDASRSVEKKKKKKVPK